MRGPSRPPKYFRALGSPFLIFSAALVLRLGVMSHLLVAFGAHTFLLNDECARIASSLVHGTGFSSPWSSTPIVPTAQQPPIYPLLLAGAFWLFGAYTHAAAIAALSLNAVAGAITACLLPYVGERCLGSRFTGVVAGWIVALWEYEVVVGLQIWTQALSALLLVALVAMLAALARPPRKLEWFGLGSYSGFAALLNPALLPAFVCAFAVRTRLTRRSLLALAGFLLLLTPWTARNFLVFGRVIPLRDNFGFELWVGNHSGVALRHPMDFRNEFPIADLRQANWDEMRFLDLKGQQAREYILARPGEFARRCAWRVLEFWMTPAPGYWLAISLLAWAGAVLAWPLDKSFFLILLTFPAVYYITHVWPNYRYPIEPLMILLAVYAVLRTAHRVFRPVVNPAR